MVVTRKDSRIGFLILAILVGGIFSCQREKSLSTVPEEITTISDSSYVNNSLFQDLEGNSLSLSEFKGKKIILHFWATWCRPCIEEMPSLSRVKDLLEKENYRILLVSEEEIDEINAFEKRYDTGLTFIRYSGALSQLKIFALPTTYILNEEGDKIKEISGRINWDSEQTIQDLINLH